MAPIKSLPVKKVSNFGMGFGITRSVVYLPRNTQNNNDARGKNFNLTYDNGNLVRFTFEYNQFQSLNFSPTWLNVKASSFESNVCVIARFKNSTSYFYPIAGISFNRFSGYFTGINDYLNLKSKYQENRTVTTNWWGLNTGVGYDYNFKNSAIYITYKMRIGKTEGTNEFNIQDIALLAGYRVFVSGVKLKKIFRGTRSRYVLNKPKSKK